MAGERREDRRGARLRGDALLGCRCRCDLRGRRGLEDFDLDKTDRVEHFYPFVGGEIEPVRLDRSREVRGVNLHDTMIALAPTLRVVERYIVNLTESLLPLAEMLGMVEPGTLWHMRFRRELHRRTRERLGECWPEVVP